MGAKFAPYKYVPMSSLVFTEQDFLNLFKLRNPSYQDFCQQIQVLDVTDRSGTFAVRSDLETFVKKVSKKDDRLQKLDVYREKLYEILVTDIHKTLKKWFAAQGALPDPIWSYFELPDADILHQDVFSGRTNARFGRICKNINFQNFYNTRKLRSTDSEYVFGLMRVMVEDFRIRNSLVGPAFFDQICRYEGDSGDFWRAFMMGANRPSIFNPATYRGILDKVFSGDTLFAPVMGWNAYQIGFYSSGFRHLVATDVIPRVVYNGHELHREWKQYQADSFFEIPDKTVDLYLCASEALDVQHQFVAKYRDQVDAVLLSPPYYDLEIYDSEDQSFTNFPDYQDWLTNYWEATVRISAEVMRPGAKFGFVISNYVNKDKIMTTISEDMRDVVSKHLTLDRHYRVQWSAMAGSRQAKKTRNGNYEDLWVFRKG